VSQAQLVKEWSEKGLEKIKNEMQAEWDNISATHKSALTRAVKRSVQLKIKESKGEDVSDQLAFVDTTLNGFRLAGQIRLYSVAKSVLGDILEALGKFLIGLAKGTIPGL